ncbi:MAG: bacteriohemerythrin [Leptospirales bacterium]|nr:bacteriohemerythrin [Leptospirales bacterium]
MTNDTIVEWHDSYSVGIKLIDEQHKKLIELTNKLYNSCASDNEKIESDSIFFNAFNEIVDYVNYHFSIEEKVMERINYPEYKMHKQIHMIFTNKVLSKAEGFNLGKTNNSLYFTYNLISFVYYLRDWVLNHIAATDKRLGVHLLEMKRSGALQQIVLKTRKGVVTNRVQVR